MRFGKKWAFILGAAGVLCFSGTVWAAANQTPLTAQQALDYASTKVAADCPHWKTELDDGVYEVEFYNRKTQDYYQVDVSRSSGKLVEWEYKLQGATGSNTVDLTASDAEDKVLALYPKAEIISTKLDREDGFLEYEVHFLNGETEGWLELNPETGTILERKLQPLPANYVKPATKPDTTKPATGTDNKNLTLAEAKKLALAQVDGATLVKIEKDWDDGRLTYEGELRQGSWEYEFCIDAVSSKIIEWEKDYDDDYTAYHNGHQNHDYDHHYDDDDHDYDHHDDDDDDHDDGHHHGHHDD